MWIIDSLKEKKRLRNEKCNDLINRATTSVESITSLFSDKRRFVTADATEKWRKRNIDLLNELNSGSFQKLRKAENYSALANNKSHLSSLIDNLEKLRIQHNEQAADERASAVYSIICEVEGKKLDRQQLVAISKEVHTQPYKIDTRTKEFGQYKPDFYLPKYDIYIEYFGIDKNGNPPAYFQNDYVASMKWKRELHKANNTTMIESYAYENFEGILTSALEKKLLEKGVALAPLSQEEIWKKISEDDANVIDGLVQLIETVINLMKSNRYDIAEMRRRNASSFNLDDVSYLLDVISPIWNRYTEYLKDNDEIDFNDMINIASDYVRDGRYKSKYKMVIVDEYQDISRARYELLKALRDKYDYDLFCVGDDWQSIYRFAGSDIGYIQNFSKYWGASEVSKIETTYRFPQRLIDITSGFIMRNPLQLAKNIRGVSDADRYVLGEVQGYTDKYAIQFMLNKMDELPSKSSIFLIGRYSFDINMLDGNSELSYKYDNRNGVTKVMYSRRNDLDISYITAHKSKGLQADYVFILNNKNGKMGFPSKIQDSPILDLLLENSDSYPDAEERRLFYVAMTRAKKKVILVSLKDRESDFVKELHTQYAEEMKQEAFICPLCGGKLKHKKGQYGDFFGCENYRTTGCRYTRNIRKTKTEY